MNTKKTLKSTVGKFVKTIIACLTRVKRNRVLFLSFNGASYSDNPKSVSEALHKLDPNVEIVWGFTNCNSKIGTVPPYVKCIDFSKKIDKYRAYCSSAVVVSNFEYPSMRKSKNQFFIQTWHGDRAFKRILYATRFWKDSYEDLLESKKGFCDLAIAGSKYGENQYRTAFKYEGEVLVEGTPRDDAIVNLDNDKVAKIKAYLGVDAQKKIMMFAPTLRRDAVSNKTSQQNLLNITKTLSHLKAKYNQDWICLVRAHPAVASMSGIEYSNNVINVSKYEDMTELLLISDLLITDYSSCAGDFALLGRPIVLLQSDLEKYMEKDRDFYFEMSESPYYIANSQDELERIITELDEEKVKQNCKDILDFYGTHETGNASYAVAERILNWINR